MYYGTASVEPCDINLIASRYFMSTKSLRAIERALGTGQRERQAQATCILVYPAEMHTNLVSQVGGRQKMALLAYFTMHSRPIKTRDFLNRTLCVDNNRVNLTGFAQV